MERDELMLMLGKINSGIEELKEDNTEIKGRLCKLEDKPAQRWDTVISGFLAAIVAVVVSLFTNKIK